MCRKRPARWFVPILLGLCLLAGLGAAPVFAQTGIVSITTDRAVYQPGDSLRVCYTVGGPGPLTITDTQADGTSRSFFSGVDDGRGGCLQGTVAPPVGTECLRITAVGGTAQTCFQVGSQSPPSGPCILIYPPAPGCGGASISTDQAQYAIGSAIQICYTVPGPGPVTITDTLADGTSHALLAVFDDGSGWCFPGTITPPAGTECLRLDYDGGTAQSCFQVVRGPLVAPGRPCIAIYPPPPGCGPS